MAPINLLNFLAIFSVAILAGSYWVTPADALSVDAHHFSRHYARHVNRDAVVLKKRSRCKHRPATANSTSSTTTPTPTPTPPAKKTEHSTSSSSSSSHTSSSSNAAATPPAAVPGMTDPGSKRGLAWPNGDDPSLANFKGPKVLNLYTWNPRGPSTAKGLGFNFMPMLWCDDQIQDFVNLVKKGYANTVLGMNEPNEPGQCNISPEHGAFLWKTYIDPLKNQGYRLIAPATSSAPSGKKWMIDFFAACDGCTFHGIGAHYYDVSADGLIKYITDFWNTFHLPVLLTEFACQNFNGGPQCTKDEIFGFMSAVAKFCDSTSWVDSYFPFGAMHQMQGVNPLDSLMLSSGQPTDLGWLFINGS